MNLPRSTASPSAAGSSAPLLGKSGRKKCCNTLTEHRALITCSQAEINCQLLHHSTVPIVRGSFCPSISATNVKTLLRTPRRAESTNSSFESILLTGRKKDTVLFAMAVSFSHPTEQQHSLLFSASIVPILFHRSIWIVIRQLLNAVTLPLGRVADAYLKMDAQLVLPKHQERQSTVYKGQVPAMRLFWHHSRNKRSATFLQSIYYIYTKHNLLHMQQCFSSTAANDI